MQNKQTTARSGRLAGGESERASKKPAPSPTIVAELRKKIENEVARRRAYEASGGPQRDLRAIRRRIAADLVGLAGLCERRACRRIRRCRYSDTPCLAAHRRDVLARFSILAGYREPARNADGKDEDMTW